MSVFFSTSPIILYFYFLDEIFPGNSVIKYCFLVLEGAVELVVNDLYIDEKRSYESHHFNK